MDTQIVSTYRLIVTADEFRLISRALRGVLTDEEELQAAALQEKMLRDKHAQLQQQVDASQKAIDNIKAANC